MAGDRLLASRRSCDRRERPQHKWGKEAMNILIVEDEPEIAQLIQVSLEKESFSCSTCRDGINALRIVQEQQPDLIILDLMLPGLYQFNVKPHRKVLLK
jgi:CheY-like chemotaxis protein